MTKKPDREKHKTKTEPTTDWVAFPTLLILIAGVIVFGVLHYSVLLAVVTAISLGLYGWFWWKRRAAPMNENRPGLSRASRKTGRMTAPRKRER